MKLIVPVHQAAALAFYGSACLFGLVAVIIAGLMATQMDVSDFLGFLVSPDSRIRPTTLLVYAVFYIPCFAASLALGRLYGSGALRTRKAKAAAALGGAILTVAILLNLDIRFAVFAIVGTAYATVLLFRA
jgi:hypothetical protein